MIKPISQDCSRKICCGQVIVDLQAAVKELLENALDAGSTSVEITLKECVGRCA